jgi:very-short-patch-repair endonuclease
LKHELARSFRRKQTDVERKLWSALRNRRFARFKFRRQQPVGPYIVDFVCFETKLVVELDGSQHALPDTAVADKIRTAYLKRRGYRVKRYWNGEVNQYFDHILDDIYREMTTDQAR